MAPISKRQATSTDKSHARRGVQQLRLHQPIKGRGRRLSWTVSAIFLLLEYRQRTVREAVVTRERWSDQTEADLLWVDESIRGALNAALLHNVMRALMRVNKGMLQVHMAYLDEY